MSYQNGPVNDPNSPEGTGLPQNYEQTNELLNHGHAPSLEQPQPLETSSQFWRDADLEPAVEKELETHMTTLVTSERKNELLDMRDSFFGKQQPLNLNIQTNGFLGEGEYQGNRGTVSSRMERSLSRSQMKAIQTSEVSVLNQT